MNKIALRLEHGSPAEFTTAEMRAFEQAVREVVGALGWHRWGANVHYASRALLVEAFAAVSDPRLGILCQMLSAGRERADGCQILREIGRLLGSFPASTAPDPKIYAEEMIDEVAACSPSILALKRMGAELRRTLYWPPTISEVMEELKRQEWRLLRECEIMTCERTAEVMKIVEQKLEALDGEIAQLESELPLTLDLEAEGYPVRPSSADLRLQIDRLRGAEPRPTAIARWLYL